MIPTIQKTMELSGSVTAARHPWCAAQCAGHGTSRTPGRHYLQTQGISMRVPHPFTFWGIEKVMKPTRGGNYLLGKPSGYSN